MAIPKIKSKNANIVDKFKIDPKKIDKTNINFPYLAVFVPKKNSHCFSPLHSKRVSVEMLLLLFLSPEFNVHYCECLML